MQRYSRFTTLIRLSFYVYLLCKCKHSNVIGTCVYTGTNYIGDKTVILGCAQDNYNLIHFQYNYNGSGFVCYNK